MDTLGTFLASKQYIFPYAYVYVVNIFENIYVIQNINVNPSMNMGGV